MRARERVDAVHDGTSWSSRACWPSARSRGAEPLEQVVADAQRVGHRGQRRVHGARRREEARVDDVEVVELVRLAVRRRAPTSAGSSPKRTVPHWCATPASGIRWSRTDRLGIGPRGSRAAPSRPLSFAQQPPVRLERCGSVLARWIAPCAVDRDAVVRVRQVLASSARSRSRAWPCSRARGRARTTARPRAGCCGRDLPSIWMCPSGSSESVGAPVVVVDAERLLELRRVRRLRDRDHAGVDVRHVVAADLVGASSRARSGAGRTPSAAAAPRS